MLIQMKSLLGHSVHATDGQIGSLKDFYFDDARWLLRYLVVDVGSFIHSRKVLLSPVSIAGIDRATQTVSVNHSREEIKHSPDIDVHKPVYRQIEEQLANYYGWVAHWVPQHDLPEPQTQPAPTDEIHLRSTDNVRKYTVMALDGAVGNIDDFALDDHDWHIPLAVLDCRDYAPADMVVIPSEHIKGIRVEDHEISIDMTRDEVETAPRFHSERALEKYLPMPV